MKHPLPLPAASYFDNKVQMRLNWLFGEDIPWDSQWLFALGIMRVRSARPQVGLCLSGDCSKRDHA